MSIGIGLSTRFEYEFLTIKKSILEEKKNKAPRLALDKENVSRRDISKIARKLTDEAYTELLTKMRELHPGPEYNNIAKIYYDYDYQFKSSESQQDIEKVIRSCISENKVT